MDQKDIVGVVTCALLIFGAGYILGSGNLLTQPCKMRTTDEQIVMVEYYINHSAEVFRWFSGDYSVDNFKDDYWRYSEFGARTLLKYNIEKLCGVPLCSENITTEERIEMIKYELSHIRNVTEDNSSCMFEYCSKPRGN